MPRLRTVLFGVVAVLGVATASFVVHIRHPRPTGVAGPAADERAREIERAVDRAAWDRTLAVRFSLGGRYHHLWDRRRGLCRVRKGASEVLLDLGKRDGRAYLDGVEVQGEERKRLVGRAYAAWVNDSFWLNPLWKLFDPGTDRQIVKLPDGREALLVQYQSGGLTPGDGYLWILGPELRPTAVRLYVSVVPIAGVEASWEGWTQLSTGALVSTRHLLAGLLPVEISDLAGAATLAEIAPGPDPFAALSPTPG